MPMPRDVEARSMLRREIRLLPLDVQAELRRLRETALEMRLPEDAVWTLLAAAARVPETVRPGVRRLHRFPAARFRTRLALVCGSTRRLRKWRITPARR